MRRRLSKLMVGMGVAAGALIISAAPASAHAELISTEPSAGQVLDAPPERVLLLFSESVDPPGDAIEVFGASGDRLDVGDVNHPDGSGTAVAVDLPDLDDGAYVVTWRVTSADNHPIRGGFTFRVGDAGSDAEAEALMERLVAGEGGDSVVGIAYGSVRFAGFVGMVLLVGAAAFLVLLWPRGASDPGARRLVGIGWWTVLVTTVLGFGFQAAYAAGESLGGTVDPSLIGEVLETRGGRVWLVRLVLLAAVALGRRWLLAPGQAGSTSEPTAAGLRSLPTRWRAEAARRTTSVVAGLALLATISLAGHAASGDLVPLALVVDVVHLSAVSVWLGGLALLFLVFLRRRVDAIDAADPDDDPDLEPVVASFSNLAFAAVIVILVTGTIQGVRQLQGLEALTDTTYGRLLIVKVLVFATLVGVAAASRNWVRRRWPLHTPQLAAGLPAGPGAKAVTDHERDGDPVPTRPRTSALRRSVGIEVAIAAVVLAITALLVNTVPGREADGPTFSAELHAATLLVRVEVDPAKAGRSDVRIETLTHGGEPLAVDEVTASLSLPARDIPPIPIALTPDGDGTGRYVAQDVDIPFGGTWQLAVTARTGEFDSSEVSTNVPIR